MGHRKKAELTGEGECILFVLLFCLCVCREEPEKSQAINFVSQWMKYFKPAGIFCYPQWNGTQTLRAKQKAKHRKQQEETNVPFVWSSAIIFSCPLATVRYWLSKLWCSSNVHCPCNWGSENLLCSGLEVSRWKQLGSSKSWAKKLANRSHSWVIRTW